MMALAGMGAALTMVSTYGRAHSAALRMGYKNNICTYLLVSSKLIWHTHKLYRKLNKDCWFFRYMVEFVFPWKLFRTHSGRFYCWALWVSSHNLWFCYSLCLSTFNGLVWTYDNHLATKKIRTYRFSLLALKECRSRGKNVYDVQTKPKAILFVYLLLKSVRKFVSILLLHSFSIWKTMRVCEGLKCWSW